MHQHRHKQHGRRKVWHNANSSITSACSELILSIADRLGKDTIASSYLSDEFLSKLCDESKTPAEVRRSAAIAKWLAQEKKNASTNEFLREIDMEYNILPRVTMKQFVKFCRTIIARVLGDLKDEIVFGTFSGGASTSRRRLHSHPAEKFVGEADVTEEALKYLHLLRMEAPLLLQYKVFNDVRVVDSSVLFTVPKKTDIDRCACKEPDINMFLQKGVGNYIRNRLRRVGINLRDQSINRKLAYEGSLDSSLATIDLTSASDSISIECVRMLLPPDWFAYLDDIRSHSVRVEGETTDLEMFSSMGNGFTFELETLIFYSICRSVSYFEGIPGIVSAYGDDLVIPSQGYHATSFVLGRFGFSLNHSKSFHEGPFRESCGGHYHNGEDITPFYLKRIPTHLTDVIRVANQLRLWASADPFREYLVPSTYKLWTELASFIPEEFWGGSDLRVDTQLVSDHIPRKALIRLSMNKKLPEVGAYMQWQNDKWDRTAPDESGDEPVSTTQKCRARRVKPGDVRHRWLFHEEIVMKPNF